jgi:GT2 family glycosyltransferase
MSSLAELPVHRIAKRGSRTPKHSNALSPQFEGYVDVYGYHEAACGWIFAGWMTTEHGATFDTCDALARFEGTSLSDRNDIIYYPRPDVEERGLGFVFFLSSPTKTANNFQCLSFELGGAARDVMLAHGASHMRPSELEAHLQSLLYEDLGDTQRQKLKQLIHIATGAASVSGCIEFFGHHPAAGGWVIAGWTAQPWAPDAAPATITIATEDGDREEPVLAKLYSRPDLPGTNGAQGFVFFLPDKSQPIPALRAVGLRHNVILHWISPRRDAQHLRGAELAQRLSTALRDEATGARRDWLINVLLRRPYIGESTIDALDPAISLCIDEAIPCGADGIVLLGWLLAQPQDIAAIKLHCGHNSVTLDPRDFVRISRPDVLASFPNHGLEDQRCGFVAYLPHAIKPHEALYLQVDARDGCAGYVPIPRSRLSGLVAIKRLLEAVDVRFLDMRAAFDNVLGPAVAAINSDRLAKPVAETVFAYGAPPPAPKFSVIIPLYGRLDFLEYQQALFSARPYAGDIEFIYVVDDPSLRREADYLCISVYERFQVPFKVVHLERNVGYAQANNIGLRYASGDFVAFLNSDVFPGTPDWLTRLSDRLTADPALGVVGALLLYEDGSVQHQGMYYKALPEFGNWFFAHHHDKGKRYHRGERLLPCVSITGACMVMRHDLATRMCGFDEGYVIGDFEDSDLCLRIRASGLGCAVDPTVKMFHLERQSQSRSAVGWRMNLTAYNAWQHHRRWAQTIEANYLA